MEKRSNIPLFVFTLLFASSLLGAWTWFNTDLGRSSSVSSLQPGTPRVWLAAKTNVVGYVFMEDAVSDEVKKILGTTNILSGTFQRIPEAGRADVVPSTDARLDLPPRITMFVATSRPETKKAMLMLGHTPDICWTSTGWKMVDSHHPKHLKIDLPLDTDTTSFQSPTRIAIREPRSGEPESAFALRNRSFMTLPFSYHIFESPNHTSHELAIWTALVGGEPLSGRIDPDSSGTVFLARILPTRNGAIHQLCDLTRRRLPVRDIKQFVRYSIPVTGDFTVALQQISHLFSINPPLIVAHPLPLADY